MSQRAAFSIAGQALKAGRLSRLEIPVARLATGTWLSLPISVVHGRFDGPTVFICAAIHGDELNGIEIIRQVLAALNPKTFSGTLIAVPIVNVFGFVEQSRYLPDRRDLNRSFPGSARGSLAARLAHLFMREIVLRSDAGIDLHTASHYRANLPQVRADVNDAQVHTLAHSFGAPLILAAKHRSGSLRASAAAQGIPVLVYEAGEAHRFDSEAICVGVEGSLRLIAHLAMIEPRPSVERETITAHNSQWLRASRGGICHQQVSLGQWLNRGEVAAIIMDAFGQQQSKMRVARDGMVIGQSTNPLVQQGDALVHIAYVEGAG